MHTTWKFFRNITIGNDRGRGENNQRLKSLHLKYFNKLSKTKTTAKTLREVKQ